MNMRRSQVLGCGSYLPERVVTNAELAAQVETSDDWIVARTGIRQRHLAAPGQMTSDLGISACRRALDHANMTPGDVDLLVVGTTTPDDTFPSTATKIQASLGIRRGAAFDVQAVCAGFVFALAVADNFIKAGQARTALVVGAETYSRIIDWTDRNTCVLFGDGAGAVVLGAAPVGTDEAEARTSDRGVLSTHLHSDGRLREILFVDGGPSATQTVGHLRMSGKDVYRHAVANLSAVAEEALTANGLTIDDVDWLVPHQANSRILEAVGRRLGLPAERTIMTVDRHANTSAASIPLALDEASRTGRLKAGDLVLLEGIGGGMAWGAALVRW